MGKEARYAEEHREECRNDAERDGHVATEREAQDRHETDEHDGHGGIDPGRELERLVTASALNGTFDDFVSGK